MLASLRGGCYFHIYMPNKPTRCGSKIVGPTDAYTSNSYNVCLYLIQYSDGFTLSHDEEQKL